MNRAQRFWLILSCLSMTYLVTRSFADKDIALVRVEGRAQAKTRNVVVAGRTMQEKDWWVEISFRNDGSQNVIVNPYDFTITDSRGNTFLYIDIPEIPRASLLTNIQVQPQSTIKKILGYRAASNQAYPQAITYETPSTVAYGKVSLVTQGAQSGVKEESPYSPARAPVPVPTVSPQAQEAQWASSKASKEAAAARDSTIGVLEEEIINKYIKLQDDNKKSYENKTITFDTFMTTKDNLEKQKAKAIIEAHQKGQKVYDDTFTRVSTAYYQQKKK